MKPPAVGADVRILASTALIGALVAGCGTSDSNQDSAQGANCREFLGSTIGLIRAGQAGNGHDPLSHAIERLRLGGCSKHWQVFADYSSVRTMSKQFGPDPCSELTNYNIKLAAIRLLRQDGLCEGRRGGSPPANTPADETQPVDEIPWNEAIQNVGSTSRVCGELAGTGASADDVFLNIGRNYPDPERFTIVLWDVGSVESPPTGTTLCASGRVTLYEGVAQIELRSIGAVEIYG